MLCGLIAQFPEPIFEPLWQQLYDILLNSRRFLQDRTVHLDKVHASAVPVVNASEMFLRCIIDVFQAELGRSHHDALDILETMAWFLLDRGSGKEALLRFKQSLQHQ